MVGVLSADILASANGIAAPAGDLLILLRHRALLFGILGTLIIVSAFRRHLQPAAMLVGLVSMLGFVVLAMGTGDFGPELRKVAMIDVVALLVLTGTGVDGGMNMAELVLESTITCPTCGYRKTEVMPTDACQYFYECEACHSLLKPDKGDCCVFCSFGTTVCPPMQQGSGCCAGKN